MVWQMSSNNPNLALWYDDGKAGVQGVPDVIGIFSVTLTVTEAVTVENFDSFTFTLEVVTEDLTDCIDCYLQGEIVLEDRYLNKYTYHLVVTRASCHINFFRWDFGDGTHKTTTSKTVEHWYWEPWFKSQWLNVTVTAYTDCGISRPLREYMYVDNTWEIWICMLVLLTASVLAMRRVFVTVARKRTVRKRTVGK